MFNSKQYEWSNIEVVMFGRPITGIRGVTYKATQEKEVIYGRGNQPLSVQKGNKAYECTLSLLQSELEALLIAVGKGKNVLDLPAFDIVVAYKANDSIEIITDIVKNVEFTEMEKGLKQNDKFMEIELPAIALGIDYNV